MLDGGKEGYWTGGKEEGGKEGSSVQVRLYFCPVQQRQIFPLNLCRHNWLLINFSKNIYLEYIGKYIKLD